MPRRKKRGRDEPRFPQFSRLPTEIRLMIWEYALSPRAAVVGSAFWANVYGPVVSSRFRLEFKLLANVSPLFAATHESRAVASKDDHHELEFGVEDSPDTVLIGAHDVLVVHETDRNWIALQRQVRTHRCVGTPRIIGECLWR